MPVSERLETDGVIAVEESNNDKTGPCSCTYCHQKSCPPTCPFYHNGCYAEYNNVGRFILPRLLTAEGRLDALILAKREAKAIRGLTGKRPLRLHVVGDCRTGAAARTVSSACQEYSSRYGQPSWSYTHAWRDVPRDAWGDVSILASCEKPEDLTAAHERGYAAAMVVEQHESPKAVELPGGFKGVPCVEQTKGVRCTDCRLCFDAPRLFREKLAILFAAHGLGENKVKAVLR
jgi:hypothetical protein